MKNSAKILFQKYKHGLMLLYCVVYMVWFTWLEKHVTGDFHVIHMGIDDRIPFIEFFVVPYILWFVYQAVTVIYFFFKDVKGYYRLMFFLFSGMTVFLIISTVYPNGQLLRPDVFPRDNIFTDLVKYIYSVDTPTNILPSIHVYNSIGVAIAIAKSEDLKKRPAVQWGAYVLTTLIVLSTMFIKQHSMFDVMCGVLMATVMYVVVYRPQPAPRPEKENVKLKHQLS